MHKSKKRQNDKKEERKSGIKIKTKKKKAVKFVA